jgi:AcrR family transcriptional regulator
MFMRALPGRHSRATGSAPPASVTRSTAHADQRRRILRALSELVAERGYPDVSVELIVKRAHVSYKTFYKHFGSKEEGFIALFQAAVARTETSIRERLDSTPGSWPDRVALALRTLFEAIAADPVVARAVLVEALAMGSPITERYEQAVQEFAPLFQGGREVGSRAVELPATVEATLAGAVFWTAYQRLVVGEAAHLTADLPALLELVLRPYLGPEEASRIARDEASGLQPALA